MFIVADTEHSNIGAKHDYPFMKQKAKYYARVANLQLKTYYFEKKHTNQYTLNNRIKNMSCGSDDVIWFYYTGHGISTARNTRFPSFIIKPSGNLVAGSVIEFSLEKIHEMFKRKNPRLLITMYDCCNFHNFTNQSLPLVPRTEPNTQEKANFLKLFRCSKGEIKVASNTNGYHKWSYGNAQIGGIFTGNFISSLEKLVKKSGSGCSWGRILKETKSAVEITANADDKHQIPDYDINIRLVEHEATPNSSFNRDYLSN